MGERAPHERAGPPRRRRDVLHAHAEAGAFRLLFGHGRAVTGADPGTTGVSSEDTYNHALLTAGTTSCKGVAPGTEVTYLEALEKNPSSLDAGQQLAGLSGPAGQHRL
jgi:hypothetical protein